MSQHCILITGGTGFAGSHLVEYLLSQGETNLHVTTLPSSIKTNESAPWLIPSERIHGLDLMDKTAVTDLIRDVRPTQIYHLAAISEVGSSFKIADKVLVNNTLLQINLLEAIRDFSPQTRVLTIGSAQEYDVHQPIPVTGIDEHHPLGPGNPYAVSKVMQDLLALSYFYSYHLDVVRVRPFNHIGERQSALFAIPSFAEQIVHVEKGIKESIKIGNLNAVRDFTDVKDIVRGYVTLMTHGLTGEVYNIGSGHGITMQTVLDILVSLSHTSIKIESDPEKFRPQDAAQIVANISKINTLGWQPEIPLRETLERVIEYWRAL